MASDEIHVRTVSESKTDSTKTIIAVARARNHTHFRRKELNAADALMMRLRNAPFCFTYLCTSFLLLFVPLSLLPLPKLRTKWPETRKPLCCLSSGDRSSAERPSEPYANSSLFRIATKVTMRERAQ